MLFSLALPTSWVTKKVSYLEFTLLNFQYLLPFHLRLLSMFWMLRLNTNCLFVQIFEESKLIIN